MSNNNTEGRTPNHVARIRFLVALVFTAVLAALFAIIFRWTLKQSLSRLFGADDIVTAMRGLQWWARLLFPAAGALLGGLLGMRATAGPAGQVGDVMEAVVLGKVRLSLPRTLWKSAASWFAIASGGSLGREGPLIQFGGASGNAMGRRFKLSLEQTRLLIAAGTAAGFAAAYNTPFAAVLFVLEIVLGVVVLDAIVPVLIATVISASLTRFFVGAGPIYGARSFKIESAIELIAFVVVGLVAALGAQFFMRVLSFGERAFRRESLPAPWRQALGGLIAGAVVMVIPDVAGNGFEPLNELLNGSVLTSAVLFVLLGKIVATTASVSSGSPGGVFTPTLLLGGALGVLSGHVLQSFGLQTGPLGGYALVGMAAATAATTHAPLMAAVMVFELSGDYAIVLPLMLATGLATFVSRLMRRESIYTAELKARGVTWEMTLEGRSEETNAR